MPGRVIGEGTNTQPIGVYGVKSYKVEEIVLSGPTEIQIDGQTIVADRAWRMTITGGPFPVRAMPATIRIDDAALGYASETTDLRGVAAITFDRSQLREDAVISLAYGGEDPVRLPERLKLGNAGR